MSCPIPKSEADSLNRESGRIYTGVMVEHWRIYRNTGHWLSPWGEQRLADYLTRTDAPLLHAHSKDAAQQGFAKAASVTRSLRKQGVDAHFPRHRKYYRTTIWKSTGIRVRGGIMLLARARGLPPIEVKLPVSLQDKTFCEARLVYDRVSSRYNWHLVVDDGLLPPSPPGTSTIAIDLGEIHPAVCTDGAQSIVISCRELRAQRQYTQKRGAVLRSLQDRKTRGSQHRKRIKRREVRFRAKQKRRIRDLEHKISREVVDFGIEATAGTIVIGDVRDIADKIDCGHKHNQRMSTWAHGRLRAYITYKAEYSGIKVELVDEHYTTQSCPACGRRAKPKGRVYTCLSCGFRGHRDAVGAANILSRHLYGELSRVPCAESKYRYPYVNRGKRSRLDTAEMARL